MVFLVSVARASGFGKKWAAKAAENFAVLKETWTPAERAQRGAFVQPEDDIMFLPAPGGLIKSVLATAGMSEVDSNAPALAALGRSTPFSFLFLKLLGCAVA